MSEKKIEIKASWEKSFLVWWNIALESKSPIERMNIWLAENWKVDTKDKVVFFRLLSTMINSWMSLVDSLQILKDQSASPKLQLVIWKIMNRISWWSTLADSMSVHPDVFDKASVWIIRAWEKSGQLNNILKNLATQIENFAKLAWKIKWALMYPAVIILIVIWAISVIMTTVIPQIKEMFSSMWAVLPMPTQVLINISDFLLSKNSLIWVNNWLLVLWGAIAFFVVLKKLLNTKKGAYYFSLILLRTPMFKTIVQKMVVAKFCRWMSILIWSWMWIIDVLWLVSDMVWNEAYRLRTKRIVADVKQWLTMSQNMKKDVLYYPPMLVSMIAVWEKTAQLEEVTTKVAEFYEDEVNTIVDNLMSLLEPVIIVVVWGTVWWIIVAIMLPIMSISDIIW